MFMNSKKLKPAIWSLVQFLFNLGSAQPISHLLGGKYLCPSLFGLCTVQRLYPSPAGFTAWHGLSALWHVLY